MGDASKFAPRGGLEPAALQELVDQDLPLREIASRVDRSIATVRYWLERFGIERRDVRGKADFDPSMAPREMVLECSTHGRTPFVLEGRGYYRCKLCRQVRVSEWRRRLKRRIVAEAGGACVVCGYRACIAALQFHHVDPATKTFALSDKGLARAIEKVRAEAAKCVLLCANCHAEVESGYRVLPTSS